MNSKQRTTELLDVAVRLAERAGLQALTREAIAREAGVSDGLVSARLGTMVELRRSVVRAAIKSGNLPVLAQALSVRDKHAMRASDELKRRAAEWMASGA